MKLFAAKLYMDGNMYCSLMCFVHNHWLMIFELGDGKDSAVPICTEVQAEEKYSKS